MTTTSMFLAAKMKIILGPNGNRFVFPIKIYREGPETFTLSPSDPTSTSPSFPPIPGRPFLLTPCTAEGYTTAFLCFTRSFIPEWHQAFHDRAAVDVQMQIWSNGSFVKAETLTVELECYENPLPAVAAYIEEVKDASKELGVAFVGFLAAVFRFPWSRKAQKLRDAQLIQGGADGQVVDVLPDAVGAPAVRALGQ